jgi:hypothetical protein
MQLELEPIHVPDDTRPVLLGMNNPVSSDPAHALFPYPPGCTGWNLLEMLRERVPDITRSRYLRVFDRRNLVDGKTWSRTAARERGMWMQNALRGREVVVLGEDVRRVIGLDKLLIEPQVKNGITWRQIPHPSGRNLWYNDPQNRMLVAVLLEQLYRSVSQQNYS